LTDSPLVTGTMPGPHDFVAGSVLARFVKPGEPAHISPIFWDLFQRQFLPLARLDLKEHHSYRSNGFVATRRRYSWMMRGFSWFVRGQCKFGDNHVLVLRTREGTPC